jgi:hypothetical protein
MSLPKGIDIIILGDENSFSSYLQQATIMTLAQRALINAGFKDVGIVYARTAQIIPTEAMTTIFDVAASFFPKILDVPITIVEQQTSPVNKEIDLVEEDLIIDRMHQQADKNARWHLRSHSKPFPL